MELTNRDPMVDHEGRPGKVAPIWSSSIGPSIVLFLLTAGVFLRVASFPSVNFDDGQYVFENPHVRNGLSWTGLKWALTTLHGDISYWHPLTWISHQLDCQFFGGRAGAHHLTNVWLHVANTLVLFAILQGLNLTIKESCFVSALFAIHPLHVESVAWISERKDVLYGLCWLVSLLLYRRFRSENRVYWYALSLFCFLLALISKPTAVTLPLVLALLEFGLPINRNPRAEKFVTREVAASDKLRWVQMARLIPFFLLALASGILTTIGQAKLGAMQNLALLPFSDRLENAAVSCAWYLCKTLLPVGLCASYVQSRPHSLVVVILAGMTLLGISWFVLAGRRREPLLPVGWFWFLLSLLPNIGLIQVGAQSHADRYTYLPLIGIFLMMAGVVRANRHRLPLPRRTLDAVAIGTVLVCSVLSYRQLAYWKGGVALFSRALELNSENWVACQGLGMALTQAGRFDEALPFLHRALALPGNAADAHKRLAICYLGMGKVQDAVHQFEASLEAEPNSAETHLLLADALVTHSSLLTGYTNQAIRLAERGIKLRSEGRADDLLTLSKAYTLSGKFPAGQAAARQAIEIAQRWHDPVLTWKSAEQLQSCQAALRNYPSSSSTDAEAGRRQVEVQ